MNLSRFTLWAIIVGFLLVTAVSIVLVNHYVAY